MDCRHQHDPHDHGHGHSHNHDDDDHIAPPNSNQAQTLWQFIDHEQVRVLNERVANSGRAILRQYEDRLSLEPYLESDADEELLITIPFTGLVKLHSVLMRSFGDERSPKTLRLYKNRDDLDFTTAQDTEPLQKLHFPEGVGSETDQDQGVVEFAVNRPKFANITSLTIHIPENWGEDTTALTYIGLRGDWQRLSRAPVVTTYEAAANPADHKVAFGKANRVNESA